jgi:hypothetical protein
MVRWFKKTDPRIQLIESRIPLIPGESGHSWISTQLWCPTCGGYEGFMCPACLRVVDHETDTPLFEAIKSLLEAEGSDDQDNPQD